MFLRKYICKSGKVFVCAFTLILVLVCCACGQVNNAENIAADYFSALNRLDFEEAQNCLDLEDSYKGLLEDLSSDDYITKLNAECFSKAVYQNLESKIINISEEKTYIDVEIRTVDSDEMTSLAYETISTLLKSQDLSAMSNEEKRAFLSETFENAYKKAYDSAEKRQSVITLELAENENGELKIKATKELFDAISGRKKPYA